MMNAALLLLVSSPASAAVARVVATVPAVSAALPALRVTGSFEGMGFTRRFPLKAELAVRSVAQALEAADEHKIMGSALTDLHDARTVDVEVHETYTQSITESRVRYLARATLRALGKQEPMLIGVDAALADGSAKATTVMRGETAQRLYREIKENFGRSPSEDPLRRPSPSLIALALMSPEDRRNAERLIENKTARRGYYEDLDGQLEAYDRAQEKQRRSLERRRPIAVPSPKPAPAPAKPAPVEPEPVRDHVDLSKLRGYSSAIEEAVVIDGALWLKGYGSSLGWYRFPGSYSARKGRLYDSAGRRVTVIGLGHHLEVEG